MTATARDAPRHWNVPETTGAAAVEYAWAAVLLGGPGLILGLGGAWLSGPAVGAAVAVVYVIGVGLWIGIQGRRLLRRLGARPLLGEEAPRGVSRARGISEDVGIPHPELWVVSDATPNALVCRAGGGAVVVSRGLLERFTRTELEAVIAHCMLRLADPGLVRASVAAALGGLAGPLVPHRDLAEDSSAAALTRYPPALANAIGKCEPRDDKWGSFWFVPAGSRFPSAQRRIRALADL